MKISALLTSLLLLLCGCTAINHNYVISATGTIIGVQVAQNPVSQIYEAKLGYARSEIALVPTNKGTNDTVVPGTNGAKDSPSVIMELRYNGIFSLSGGIYQRLAVGDVAVSQPGAAFMFAKDQNGTLSAPAASAVSASIKAIPTTDSAVTSTLSVLARAYMASGTNKWHWDVIAKQFGYTTFSDILNDPALTVTKILEITAAMKSSGLL